ncbi:protein phosphatase CheZ [uncultured Cohaesibacter sp.]|uniref:protein phosphatase CheZ n=1 Tax=uncultured Cohaesibacter sp. TaxID=1002546 RepID=UPI002AA7FC2F|nr:protein phosphatase CheZ [uncultured Cohaesibacter sp.]
MPPTPLRQEDYLAIEAAVMETARGRWFLAEYARRNRNADTDTLLTAIDKLEKTVVRERAPSSLMHQVRMDLTDMANAIERTKTEIAQIKHEDNQGSERFERATVELDAIVSQTESATGDILGAAEKIQEFAWTLREMGADSDKCDELDMEATNIYMACSFQDLTGQRIRKIVDAMRYVESRINSMIDIWGFESEGIEVDQHDHRRHDQRPDAHLLNGPALEGEGVGQDDVDNLFSAPDLYEEADQNDVDALFDSNDKSDQDDVDALFDTASSDDEPSEEECDLSAEMSQDDADALFAKASEVEADDEAEAEAEMVEAAASSEDMSSDDMTEVAAEVSAEDTADDDVVDADFMDMQDLDWAAEAEADTDAADYLETVEPEAVSEADDQEADIFATADSEILSEQESLDMTAQDEGEAMPPAEDGEPDIFASADIFDKALNEELASSDEEEELLDLRDRVAQFS